MKEDSPCKGCVFYDEGGYGVAQEGIISHCHHSEFYNRMDMCPVIQSYYIKRNLGLNKKGQMGIEERATVVRAGSSQIAHTGI